MSSPGGRRAHRPKRKRTRRSPTWAMVLIAFGVLMLLASGGMLIFVQIFTNSIKDSVQTADLFGDAGAAHVSKVPDGPLNILMVGLDARPDRSEANSRADTVIVLHITASHNQAYLISVPRDLLVTVSPFPKSGFAGGRAKLTETFFHGAQKSAGVAGGMELLVRTLRDTSDTDLTFNGAALINFDSFLKVVEQLGGVDLCVDQNVESKHMYVDAKGNPTNIEGVADPERFGKPAVYRKGECRRFKAWEALDYSRQRYGLEHGDYDRQRHQLQLLKAIVKEATGKKMLTNPVKLNEIIKAAGAAFTIDTRGVPITDYMLSLGSIGSSELITLRTNGGKLASKNIDGISYETLTPDSVQMFKAVRDDSLAQFVVTHPEFLGA